MKYFVWTLEDCNVVSCLDLLELGLLDKRGFRQIENQKSMKQKFYGMSEKACDVTMLRYR